ncbi:hypothetical protein QEG57_002538 [Stenotrophomonas maltophilia]|nr:hypothetical protein [Stenotrophomonas maltophilia]
MAKYLVGMPFQAVQFFHVEARSAAEAKRLAREGEGGPVEAIDWRVTKHFAPNYARPVDSEVVGNG